MSFGYMSTHKNHVDQTLIKLVIDDANDDNDINNNDNNKHNNNDNNDNDKNTTDNSA